MVIDAKGLDFKTLNEKIKSAPDKVKITGCSGQRFMLAGAENKDAVISDGIPGNALGAYLNGGRIEVFSNAQDAVGDTMNSGEIVIHGNIGDAAGYAMRGGKIFVRGNAGYRAGIHMKAYKEKHPTLVIGGRAGSFLGEYQAGGTIVVLGLDKGDEPIVGAFPCTGMHGGKMFLMGDTSKIKFPPQVTAKKATESEKEDIRPYIEEFCAHFSLKSAEIMDHEFTLVLPDTKNPFKQMYVSN